jgi:hypothetical protein
MKFLERRRHDWQRNSRIFHDTKEGAASKAAVELNVLQSLEVSPEKDG